MLKVLLEQIAIANSWIFLYGSEKDFNISADDQEPDLVVLFMVGYGTAKSVSYDTQGAMVSTYPVTLFLLRQSQLTDDPQTRFPYFDELEVLTDTLTSAMIDGATDWKNENRVEIKNFVDRNMDGHKITGNITFPGQRVC
jgi:hypothetical protein